MKEGNKRRPATAEEWSEYLSEFAHKWEFGSPEYNAVSDFLNLQQLFGLYVRIGKEPVSQQAYMSGATTFSTEDRKTLIVRRIALLEHTLEQNESRIQGYASAYVEMSSSFDFLIGTAAYEARTKFSNSEEKQTVYIQSIVNQTLDDVYGSVFEK